MRSSQKYDLSNFGVGRRGEHTCLSLLAREVTSDDKPAHAVRHDVNLWHGLAVVVFQRSKELTQFVSEIFDGRMIVSVLAVVEEDGSTSVALQNLVGRAKRALECCAAATVLVSINKNDGRLAGARDRSDIRYKLCTGCGAADEDRNRNRDQAKSRTHPTTINPTESPHHIPVTPYPRTNARK